MSQEEVDNTAGHHAPGEAIEGPEPSPPLVKTAPLLAVLQQQPELERISLHAATNLVSKQKPGPEQGQKSSF